MNNNIRIQRCKSFLTKALTLWADVGYDNEFGGYFEALDFEGNPLYSLDKRFRIHPRTIFSHTASTVWGYFDGLDIAEKAFEHITNNCWLPQGGFATLSDRKSKIIDTSIKTYDHSFVMLGFGWLYYATRKPIHHEWLMKTWDFLQSTLKHEDGGFYTGLNKDGLLEHKEQDYRDPIRLQNPHMHMLEAMLNLIELFDEDVWRKAAIDLYNIFSHHFFCKEKGILYEFFNEDWSLDPLKGHSLEPGHHAEWVWILQKYESIMNISIDAIDALYKYATSTGSNSKGFGYDEVHVNGTPIRNTHRMWVHTELLKAHVAMFKRTHDLQYIEQANQTCDSLFEYYILTETGNWHDQLDDDLKNISTNSPTSTLYHLLIACNEYIDCIDSIT